MKLFSAIAGGLVGATVLTLMHEATKRICSDAPRMDLMGMEAISKTLKSVDVKVPEEENLYRITMAGDIISNSVYYSLAAIGSKKQVVLRGILFGLAAGIGGVYLPRPMGLNDVHSNRTAETKLMTIGLYLAGGIVAAVTAKLVEKSRNV